MGAARRRGRPPRGLGLARAAVGRNRRDRQAQGRAQPQDRAAQRGRNRARDPRARWRTRRGRRTAHRDRRRPQRRRDRLARRSARCGARPEGARDGRSGARSLVYRARDRRVSEERRARSAGDGAVRGPPPHARRAERGPRGAGPRRARASRSARATDRVGRDRRQARRGGACDERDAGERRLRTARANTRAATRRGRLREPPCGGPQQFRARASARGRGSKRASLRYGMAISNRRRTRSTSPPHGFANSKKGLDRSAIRQNANMCARRPQAACSGFACLPSAM